MEISKFKKMLMESSQDIIDNINNRNESIRCLIRWKDCSTSEEVVIKLDTDDMEDDYYFYYLNGIQEILDSDNFEFEILDILEWNRKNH